MNDPDHRTHEGEHYDEHGELTGPMSEMMP